MNTVTENTMTEVPKLAGKLFREEPMSRHTSWRVGGPAAWYYVPDSIADVEQFLSWLPRNVPVFWCGLGSNTLVRDGGFNGAVIATAKGLVNLHQAGTRGVYAECGVTCAKLARFTVNNSLSGAEFLAGIPGTVGGALAMNAGCFGHETWNIVRYADTLDRYGVRRRRNAEDVDFGYRSVEKSKDEWYIGAKFTLHDGSDDDGKKKIKNFLRQRADTQPIQTANSGSVFTNPPDDHAARLIESVGLKNYTIGAARFSPKHANFIENTGQATAGDIESLIEHAIEKVQSEHGIKLNPEVRIIGSSLNGAV